MSNKLIKWFNKSIILILRCVSNELIKNWFSLVINKKNDLQMILIKNSVSCKSSTKSTLMCRKFDSYLKRYNKTVIKFKLESFQKEKMVINCESSSLL